MRALNVIFNLMVTFIYGIAGAVAVKVIVKAKGALTLGVVANKIRIELFMKYKIFYLNLMGEGFC